MPPPTLAYANANTDDRLWPTLRIVVSLWALAAGIELTLYWAMEAFQRWSNTYFPFGLQRPWYEAATAVVEGTGYLAVLLGAWRPAWLGGRWRMLLFIGGIAAGIGILAERGTTVLGPWQSLVANFDGSRQNIYGPWRYAWQDLMILAYRAVQILPRLAIPGLCVLAARVMR